MKENNHFIAHNKENIKFDTPRIVNKKIYDFLFNEYNNLNLILKKKYFNNKKEKEGLFKIEYKIYFLDIETNGLFPYEEIVDLTLKNVKINNKDFVFTINKNNSYSWYLEPENFDENIKKKFYKNGKLKKEFKNKKISKNDFKIKLEEIFKNNIILIGHNIIYDYTILKNNSLITNDNNIFLADTLDFFYLLEDYIKEKFKLEKIGYTLEEIVKLFHKSSDFLIGIHTSEVDVNNTIFIFNELLKIFKFLLENKDYPLYKYLYNKMPLDFVLFFVLNQFFKQKKFKIDFYDKPKKRNIEKDYFYSLLNNVLLEKEKGTQRNKREKIIYNKKFNSAEDYFPEYFNIRDNQKKYINEFNNFLNSKYKFCAIESPTGTGKTFAYLSEIFYDINKNKREVIYTISTYTKKLQTQIEESIINLNNSLPYEKRIKYIVIKGKHNYICWYRLFEFLKNNKFNFPTKRKMAAIFLFIKSIYNIKNNIEEIDELLPYYIRNSIGINEDDIYKFTYLRTFSVCKDCPFKEKCLIETKLKMLKEKDYNIIITNHFLLMQKIKEDNFYSNNFDKDNITSFSYLIKNKSNKVVIDEAHKLVEAYTSINEKKIGLSDIDTLKNYLIKLHDFLEYIKKLFNEYQKKEKILLTLDKIIYKIRKILNEYNKIISNFNNNIKETILNISENDNLYPEKRFSLELNYNTFKLFSKYYLKFNQQLNFFSEYKVESKNIDEIREDLEVGQEIIYHLKKYWKEKISIFEEINNFFNSYEFNTLKSNISNPDINKKLNDIILEYKGFYIYYKEKEKIFLDISIISLINNYYFLYGIFDNNINDSLVIDYYDKYKKVRKNIKSFDLVVKTGELIKEDEEYDKEELEVEDIKIKNGKSINKILDWNFYIINIINSYSIKKELLYFDKVLLTSATLSIERGDGKNFFLKEYNIKEDEIYKKSIITLPQVFNLKEQMIIAVPYYLSIPKEYFYEEFKYESSLEIIRILKFFENMEIESELKIKVLILFTSYLMLTYFKYFIRKINTTFNNEILKNFLFLFQREVSKKEITEFFLKTNNKISVFSALAGYGEGFDIVSDYNKILNRTDLPNPIKIVIINKIPFLNITSLYHRARIEYLKKEDTLLKILIKKNLEKKDSYINYSMFLYILPLTAIKLKQWIGRLIRTEKDKGIIFLTDSRFIESTYSSFLQNYIGKDIKIIFYGENFYKEKNKNIEEYFRKKSNNIKFNSIEITHYFDKLIPHIKSILGYEGDSNIIYDFEQDKIFDIRNRYWNQRYTIKHGREKRPRFFTNYFYEIFSLFINKEKEKKREVLFDEFLDKYIKSLIKDNKLRNQIIKYGKENKKKLFKDRNYPLEVNNWLKIDISVFKDKEGKKWLENEFKTFSRLLGDKWKNYVLNKLLDMGNHWHDSLIFDKDGNIGYISQRDIMAKVFGIDLTKIEDFKKGEEIRTDSVFILKTGFGKSLCFQVPSLLNKNEEGITVVFAPLKAIMRDQVESFRNSLDVTHYGYIDFIDSSFTAKNEVIKRIRNNDFRTRILYISPVRLANPEFFQLLLKAKIKRIIIDELHTLIEWGQKFSPQLNMVPVFIQQYYFENRKILPVYGFSASLHKDQEFCIRKMFKRINIDLKFYKGIYNRKNIKIISIHIKSDKKNNNNYYNNNYIKTIDTIIKKRFEWIFNKILELYFEKVKTLSGNNFYIKKRYIKTTNKTVIFCKYIGKSKRKYFKFNEAGVKSLYSFLTQKNIKLITSYRIYKKGKESDNLLFNIDIEKKDKIFIYKNKNGKEESYIINNYENISLRDFITFFYSGEEESTIIQNNFYNFKNNNNVKVIITTDAFGMGVDIPDIKYIIHCDFPESVEKYYQQIGRCRKKGISYFLYNIDDYKYMKKRIQYNDTLIEEPFVRKIIEFHLRCFDNIFCLKKNKLSELIIVSNKSIFYWFNYYKLQKFMESLLKIKLNYSIFAKNFESILPFLFNFYFNSVSFYIGGFFYNKNTIINLYNLKNNYKYFYDGNINNLLAIGNKFVPYYIKYELEKIASKKWITLNNILFKFTFYHFLYQIDLIERSNRINIKHYKRRMKDIFNDEFYSNINNLLIKENFVNLSEEYTFPFEVYIYDYILPLFLLLDLLKIEFSTYSSNIKILIKKEIKEKPYLLNTFKSITKKKVDFVDKIFNPQTKECRRYLLLSYFNEKEAKLLGKAPRNFCCDVCDLILKEKK